MATISYGRTNSTTQAQTVIDCLEDAMTRQGAYTKVATVMSATSQPCSIWRNSGNRNALGRDWYLAIARTVGTAPPSFQLAVAEGYDPQTQQLVRPAAGGSRSSTPPAEDGSLGGGIGYPIWSGNVVNSSGMLWLTVSISTSAYDSWVIATDDTVAVTYSPAGGAAGSAILAGVAEPFRDDDPGIIAITGTNTYGAVTRHPKIVAPHNDNWQIASLDAATCVWSQRSGTLGANGDRLHDSRPVASRILVRHNGASQTQGTLRGLFRNAVSIQTQVATFPPGERILIRDDMYQYPGDQPGGGGVWLATTPT